MGNTTNYCIEVVIEKCKIEYSIFIVGRTILRELGGLVWRDIQNILKGNHIML